ncbi:MAG: hypothetical protein OXC30_03295 [Alphaproteobacteria bacterium]|nr:hypothetical protein [Alphaproteobacteria bacterium]
MFKVLLILLSIHLYGEKTLCDSRGKIAYLVKIDSFGRILEGTVVDFEGQEAIKFKDGRIVRPPQILLLLKKCENRDADNLLCFQKNILQKAPNDSYVFVQRSGEGNMYADLLNNRGLTSTDSFTVGEVNISLAKKKAAVFSLREDMDSLEEYLRQEEFKQCNGPVTSAYERRSENLACCIIM